MNAVDGSDHYSKTSTEPPPSLLTIILDTNPSAWALLAPTLPPLRRHSQPSRLHKRPPGLQQRQ
ncbi:hypothetical protein ABVK25_008512 [Lepraria finkii]|uniref:General transcription and DNA repair factor IIH subunit TFB4 n=1 Tax=Lepraria finkii TaxID=1340010 RepID=A0ABR4B666_9LECA